MATNMQGDKLIDDRFFMPGDLSIEELQAVVQLLAEHLKLDIVRTNQTKHGYVEMQLEPTRE